ncbi:MAG: addiction module protein [Gemmatimonadaceae bacterium]
MATPLLGFSHLSSDQRIEVPFQLWESLDPAALGLSATDVDVLRSRRAERDADGDPGTPWRPTIPELRTRGA